MNRRDHGAATTTVVLVIPVVMLCMLIAVQVALVYHARHVATAAAQDAAWTATAQGATVDDGRRAATELLERNATGLITNQDVTVTPFADHIHVHIVSDVVALVPGMHLHIDANADSPIERLVTS
jgi:Flp pilus assembly protein TadG